MTKIYFKILPCILVVIETKNILASYCFELRLTYVVKKKLQEQGHFIYQFKMSLQSPDFNVVICQQRKTSSSIISQFKFFFNL